MLTSLTNACWYNAHVLGSGGCRPKDSHPQANDYYSLSVKQSD